MRLSSVLPTALAAALTQVSLASCTCSSSLVRKEWRSLSDDEKLEYLDAVQCMLSTPAKLSGSLDGAVARFDDFQGVHIANTPKYHFTGPFQPWHRAFLHRYEAVLRDECGYTGAQPYWDWTLDATSEEDFLASPLFNNVTGFGGNGPYVNTTELPTDELNVPTNIPYKTGGGCVTGGPFVNMTVHMGPGNSTTYNEQCLRRDMSPWLATQTLNATLTEWVMSADTYALYDFRLQGTGLAVSGMTIHAGGHMSVGGDIGIVGNMYSSPGDPIFYMHHANLDRIWNQWQRADWDSRKSDIAGPDTMYGYPFDFTGGVDYQNITLDTVLQFDNLTDDIAIRETMDIYSSPWCYSYDG